MNSNLLKAKMVEKGITQLEMAKGLGISTTSLCRKINGHNELTLSEVIKIMKTLGLTDDSFDVHRIFFS